MSIRVAIVDDHPMFRMGLAAAIREMQDVELVGEASRADAVEGLDFESWHHSDAKGITAVCRCTGRAIPVGVVRPKVREMISR